MHVDWSKRTRPADLPELMDQPCSREEMRACLRDLAWVNKLFKGYRPILEWLDSLELHKHEQPVRILDVGSGYGDTLRRIEEWAREKNIAVDLVGLDLNPDATVIAREAASTHSHVKFVNGNVFDYMPPQHPHLIMSSLLTHHLEDEEIVHLLRWMETHAEWGWIINDLSRHPIPQKLFGWFSWLTHLHQFVQYDGQVSFARAFVADDWKRYCAAAGLAADDVEIRGFTPGRLCVMRHKPMRNKLQWE